MLLYINCQLSWAGKLWDPWCAQITICPGSVQAFLVVLTLHHLWPLLCLEPSVWEELLLVSEILMLSEHTSLSPPKIGQTSEFNSGVYSFSFPYAFWTTAITYIKLTLSYKYSATCQVIMSVISNPSDGQIFIY